jgi:signal transduction histidine kinase
VSIKLDLASNAGQVKAASHALQQVLVNLINNAAQAMPGGGVVTVTSKASAIGVELAVADHGPGVSAEMKKVIFEPFYTTRTQGTGLGLAVCRHLVTEFGGTIDVEPRPGGGAVFRVNVPRVG